MLFSFAFVFSPWYTMQDTEQTPATQWDIKWYHILWNDKCRIWIRLMYWQRHSIASPLGRAMEWLLWIFFGEKLCYSEVQLYIQHRNNPTVGHGFIWRWGQSEDFLASLSILSSKALPSEVNANYRQVSNIRRTLVGNKIFDHSDVVRVSAVGAAPTTSSFST